MQMIYDAVTPERLKRFLESEKGPSPEAIAEKRDSELRAKRDQADEARDRAAFERRKEARVR